MAALRGPAAALVLTGLICLVAGAALADTDETLPFATTHISVDGWQRLFDEIAASPGRRVLAHPDRPDTVTIALPDRREVYCFTKRGPAFPAVILARILAGEGRVWFEERGYYAGSKFEFAAWYQAIPAESLGADLQAATPGR